ncbi:helix-turn-helix domain-containing protein [Candidatus Enterenecus avicola]
MSSKYYGSIENGKNAPTIEKLSSIAKVLGCRLSITWMTWKTCDRRKGSSSTNVQYNSS